MIYILDTEAVIMQIRVSCGLIQELESPLLKFPGGDEDGGRRNKLDSNTDRPIGN
jgi:hypothetical protein